MKSFTRTLLLLGLAACTDELTADSTQDINGPGNALASQWQRDRAAVVGSCTATRISDHFAITSLRCGITAGSTVTFYGAGPNADTTLTAKVEQVYARPGATTAGCQTLGSCTDNEYKFADIALLRLSNDVTATTDSLLAGEAATLAWNYPGDSVVGQHVGAGNHNGATNSVRALRQVSEETDSVAAPNKMFTTFGDLVDTGDGGGAFYTNSQLLGVLWGEGTDHHARHTSVPGHLDWILQTIGYAWRGMPSQQFIVYLGTTSETFTGTELMCQYACEKTTSCEAYNWTVATQSCALMTKVTSAVHQTNRRSALRHGTTTGLGNEVVGYMRSDGYFSEVHPGLDGTIHENYLWYGWESATIAPMANQPIAGKLTGYRRSDGINAIVYRSTHGRIIEVALIPDVGWQAADLTNWGGNTAAGDPVAYVRADGVSAVVFRSANNHINELRLGTKKWIATDLTAASNSTAYPPASDLVPFVRNDGVSSIVYLSGSAVVELYKSGKQPWSHGVPSAIATNGIAPPAIGRPYGFTRRDGKTVIVYRAAGDGVVQLRLEPTGWKFEDHSITAPAISGNPVGFVRPDAVDSILYRSTSSHLVELLMGQSTQQSLDLTTAMSAAPMTTDPSVSLRIAGEAIVSYGLAGNHAGAMMFYEETFKWHNLGEAP